MSLPERSRIGPAEELAPLREGKLRIVGGHPVPADNRQLRSAMERKHRHAWSVALAFAAVYLIWGSTYLGIRYAVESIPPLLMMGVRHFIAGVVLYAWLRARGTPAPKLVHWRYASGAAVLLFLGGHGSLAWAEQRVPSGLAALLSATLPLWVVLLARMTGTQRKLHWQVLLGFVLGFGGVAVLSSAGFSSRSSMDWLSVGAVLLGTFLWGAGTIYVSRVRLPSDSMLSSAIQMILGGAILLVTSLATGEAAHLHTSAITWKSVLALAYLIVFGSIIAFTAFTWLNRASTPTRVSTYAYVNPVVAVILGWTLAGESVGWRTLVAIPIILSGVALVNRGRSQPSTQRDEALRNSTPVRHAAENC